MQKIKKNLKKPKKTQKKPGTKHFYKEKLKVLI